VKEYMWENRDKLYKYTDGKYQWLDTNSKF
jgi:hypothetical protein